MPQNKTGPRPQYSLPTNIRNLMAEHRLTFARLSERSKVPVKTLYHWGAGQRPKNLEQIKAVCDTFGVSMEELVFGEERQPAASDGRDQLILGRGAELHPAFELHNTFRTSISQNIAVWLTQMRERSRMGLEEVGRASGYQPWEIYRWEQEGSIPLEGLLNLGDIYAQPPEVIGTKVQMLYKRIKKQTELAEQSLLRSNN